MDFDPSGVGQEKGNPRASGYMLHVNDGKCFPPEGPEQLTGLGAGLGAAGQLHRPAGEIVVLDIDE